MVLNIILLLFVNYLKDFLWFTDCLTIGVLITSMNHGHTNDLILDFSNNNIYIYILLGFIELQDGGFYGSVC